MHHKHLDYGNDLRFSESIYYYFFTLYPSLSDNFRDTLNKALAVVESSI